MSEENKCTEMSATADCMVVEHTSKKKNMYKEIPAAIDAMIEHKSMSKLLHVLATPPLELDDDYDADVDTDVSEDSARDEYGDVPKTIAQHTPKKPQTPKHGKCADTPKMQETQPHVTPCKVFFSMHIVVRLFQ